mgnify:CR=1 FL=1
MIEPTSSTSSLLGGTAPTTGGLGATPAASRDQFLRLFVAQLEHQNPLDPQSGAEMVAQLAQFSAVEQAVETNRRLADLISAEDAAGTAALADLVGREVTADASTLSLDGPPPPIQVSAGAPIASGELVIRSASGAEVRRVPFEGGTSPLPVAWDGTDARGVPLAAGTYSIEVVARGADGAAVSARPQTRALVDAVELTPDGPLLRLGGTRISPAAITTIARGTP